MNNNYNMILNLPNNIPLVYSCSERFLEIWKKPWKITQGLRKVWKSGRACSTVVGIICPPLFEIGLTGEGGVAKATPPAPCLRQALYLINILKGLT